jgi:Mg-chelatase subunit ChlI
VVVRGLEDKEERLEAYRRVYAYQQSPRRVTHAYMPDIEQAREEIQLVRDILSDVVLPDDVAQEGLQMVHKLGIDSLRAEITLFEAARAYAALDGRLEVRTEDVFEVAPMALRLRRSQFMEEFFTRQDGEEQELTGLISEGRQKQSRP